MGHAEITWSAVCLVAPHLQFVKGARPHLYMDERKRPTSVRRRLSLIQDVLGEPISKGLVLALGMKARSMDARVFHTSTTFDFSNGYQSF